MANFHRGEGREEPVCMVNGCSSPAVRSLPGKKVEGNIAAGLKTEARRVHLCKEHYKEYKRNTKQERLANSLSWER
ncbi:MAG: hypothetical protein ACUVV6_01025 [Thermoplasmatota archaeon]